MSSERESAARRAKASGSISLRTTTRGVTKYEARVSAPGQGAGLRRQYGKTFATRADAQRWLNTELAALSNGMASADPSITLQRWLESWLAHTTLRPTSLRSYRDLMHQHVIPRLGSVRLVDLRPGQLNEMYGAIMEDSQAASAEVGRPRRPLSPATIHKINAVLRSALSDAERDGYVPRNVARLTRLPKKVAPARQWWTVQQVHTFVEATAEDRLAALWVLLLRTGLRRGEALGLRWIDVDLDSTGPGTYPQARVVQQIITVGGVATRGEPKTDNGRRVVVLDGVVVAALRAWRRQQVTEQLAAGSLWVGDPEVFTREDGRILDPNAVTRRFQVLAAAAGLPPIRLHDLRHTYASHSRAAGTDLKLLSSLLGHSDIAITANLYSHVGADERVAAAALLSARLDS